MKNKLQNQKVEVLLKQEGSHFPLVKWSGPFQLLEEREEGLKGTDILNLHSYIFCLVKGESHQFPRDVSVLLLVCRHLSAKFCQPCFLFSVFSQCCHLARSPVSCLLPGLVPPHTWWQPGQHGL